MSAIDAVVGNKIHIRGLGISFAAAAARTEAIRGLDLAVEAGEFVSVLGPSGCGKSTLVSALAGLLKPSDGELLVGDAIVRAPGADRGVVFQHPTLFPWKTVFANVEFGLKSRGFPKAERVAAVEQILNQVGLEDFARHFPAQLSGGMQQRVNLARALVNRPRVLLMDEPFAALDAQTRFEMQELLLEIWGREKMTVVFVTHDIDEAIFLADRVIVLTRRPAQVKTALLVELERPRTTTVLTHSIFVELKRQCLEQLRSEAARNHRVAATEEVPALVVGGAPETASAS
jgi:NitT/TauT family transport system ATP-binding protein